MTNLDKLLQGVDVEWKTLGEVAELYGGLIGKSKSDFENGNSKYVSYKNIFYNIEVDFESLENVTVSVNENQHEVKYGDVLFTGSSEIAEESGMSSSVTLKLDEKIYLNSFSFGLRFNSNIEIIPEFSKYLFRSLFMRKSIAKSASGVTRYNISKERFKKILIPIPPLAVQKEIVSILDTFTELTTELAAALKSEHEARKLQYQYYREQLLTFKDKDVEWKTLGEVADIGTGSHNTQDALDNGNFTFYARGIAPLKLDTYDYDETAIVTAGDGVGVGKVFHWADGKYALHQRAYRIVPHPLVSSRYVFHYIVTKFYEYIVKTSVSSSVTSMRKPMFINFPIPIPSLEEQARIVSILDKFDNLTTSISEGLAGEIELRRKQYEYYRDLLLTFPKNNIES